MDYTEVDIKKNKRLPCLPHAWGVQANVEMLRAHGPFITRKQYIGALCMLKPEAKLEVERRAVLRRTKTRVFIKMED